MKRLGNPSKLCKRVVNNTNYVTADKNKVREKKKTKCLRVKVTIRLIAVTSPDKCNSGESPALAHGLDIDIERVLFLNSESL